MSETDIKRAIMDYLELEASRGKLHFWPVHLGPVKVGGARKRNPMRGHPDIAGVLVPTGRYFGIEVKKPNERFTQEQMDWALKLQKAGALFLTATCVEEVIEGLGKAG